MVMLAYVQLSGLLSSYKVKERVVKIRLLFSRQRESKPSRKVYLFDTLTTATQYYWLSVITKSVLFLLSENLCSIIKKQYIIIILK